MSKDARAIERIVAEVLSDVLDAGPVGPEDEFFTLGGNSVLAIKVVALLRERLPMEVRMRDLFEHSTPATLARALMAKAG